MSALEGLGNARYFFVFLLGWSLVSNNVFNLYSIGISAQLFGDWAIKVPRILWTLCASILITILAVVGRDSFSAVLLNLLALIGYWSMIYFAIFTIEFVLIRRKFGLDLTAWNDRTRLPPGYAAGLAFCLGVVGSILGMSQTWYQGYISHSHIVRNETNDHAEKLGS
jgi:purine-cytosine permease-like protein